MRAIVQDRYGAPEDVLRLADVPTPSFGAGEVLVRVHASSASPWDWHFIRGEPLLMRPVGIGGIRRPKYLIPGGDVAGIVEAVGARVTTMSPGDPVYGFTHGAFADLVAASEGSLARKPASLTFEEAASIPLQGSTALQCLRAGGLSAGEEVMVIGASGGVGTLAVQIAKHLGARVTGVCSGRNVGLVASLGADEVLDYRTTDITAVSERYDLILQLGGTYSPRAIRRILAPRGRLIQSYGDGNRWVGPLMAMGQAAVLNLFVGQTLKAVTTTQDTATLDELRALVEEGHLRPVIDRVVPLERAPEAVALVERGSPGGKVIVQVRTTGDG